MGIYEYERGKNIHIENAQYFHCSIFSERHFYLEDWSNLYTYSSKSDKKIIEDKTKINNTLITINGSSTIY